MFEFYWLCKSSCTYIFVLILEHIIKDHSVKGIYLNCKSHKVKQLALWIQSIPLIIIELMRLDGECLGLGENYCRLQCFWIFNWFARKFVINWIDLDRDGLDTRNMGIIWLRMLKMQADIEKQKPENANRKLTQKS